SPIPHEHFTVGRIDDGRRPASELFHAMSDTFRQTVSPPERGVVARSARQEVGRRQARVEVQSLAERDLFQCVGVIFGEGDRIWAAILSLELLDRGNRLFLRFEGCGFANRRGLTSRCDQREQDSRSCCRKTDVARGCGSHSIILKDLGLLVEGNGKELVRPLVAEDFRLMGDRLFASFYNPDTAIGGKIPSSWKFCRMNDGAPFLCKEA